MIEKKAVLNALIALITKTSERTLTNSEIWSYLNKLITDIYNGHFDVKEEKDD